MMKKNLLISASVMVGFVLSASPIFAHSIVSPREVGVAAFQDFSLSVPSEKDATTTSVRLLLPPGLNFVSPVVKPGWKVTVKSGPIPSGMTPPIASDGDVATSIPTEIDWTGGAIPAGQKDIFGFSAQVPAQTVELDWKVYQNYSDGSTVSWDQGPNAQQPKNDKGMSDFSKVGPYSKTMVINDLTGANAGMSMTHPNANGGSNATPQPAVMTPAQPTSKKLLLALALGAIGSALGAISFGMVLQKK